MVFAGEKVSPCEEGHTKDVTQVQRRSSDSSRICLYNRWRLYDM